MEKMRTTVKNNNALQRRNIKQRKEDHYANINEKRILVCSRFTTIIW